MSECHRLISVRSSVLLWVGGWWRMAAVCRLEDGEQMPVLTGRNSKRRFRGTLEWERTRHRRHSRRCRGQSGNGSVKIVCNRRCNEALRAVTERRCRGGTERQPKRRGGVVEEAEWNCRAQSIDPKTAAVVSRSGENRSLDQRCSDTEGYRHQSEDVLRSVWPTSATSREGQRR